MKMRIKKRGKTIAICMGTFLVLFGMILIYFNISFSPTKQSFNNKVAAAIAEQTDLSTQIIDKEDFSHLPLAIRQYLENCGYFGQAKMSYMSIPFYDVDFTQGRGGRKMTIDYKQFNLSFRPDRFALIESSVMGIPFEGLDSLADGVGGMKGTIAKSITLFNETGAEMDKACLVTYLAESMFIPSSFLQGYITLEEIDAYHVKGIISFGGVQAEGIFVFNEKYEMVSFTTEDRAATGSDGSIDYIPWSAICSEYKTNEDGYTHPTVFQAVWHYEDGDFMYFDGKLAGIKYDGK